MGELFTELILKIWHRIFIPNGRTQSLQMQESMFQKKYRSFQTALVREISKYATAVGAKVTFNLKGHYNTSCFIERNGKFVYISHSSGLSRMGSGVKIELDSFLIRTAQHAKDYRGGHNQYCDITNLQSMIDNLLE